MFITLLSENVLLLVTWGTLKQSYPRALSVLAFGGPAALAICSLGTMALLLAGRSSLGLVYFTSVLLVSLLFGAALLQLARGGDIGLVGMIVLLIVWDIGIILVVHQLLG